MQAAPGVMEQFIADNSEMIASSGHVLESTVSQVYLPAGWSGVLPGAGPAARLAVATAISS